jgi:hypothetical protein
VLSGATAGIRIRAGRKPGPFFWHAAEEASYGRIALAGQIGDGWSNLLGICRF